MNSVVESTVIHTTVIIIVSVSIFILYCMCFLLDKTNIVTIFLIHQDYDTVTLYFHIVAVGKDFMGAQILKQAIEKSIQSCLPYVHREVVPFFLPETSGSIVYSYICLRRGFCCPYTFGFCLLNLSVCIKFIFLGLFAQLSTLKLKSSHWNSHCGADMVR